MAQKAVVDTVMAELVPTGIAVIKMNEGGETPADGSNFIQVQFPVADVTRPTVDRKHYREDGGFRIILNTQRGAGLSTLLTTMGDLAALFRDKKIGSMKCGVPSSPFLDDSNDAGNFFVASMVIPYTYDFNG